MAANAITYAEIDAYDRRMSADLSIWAVRLIRRIDDAVLAIMAPASEPPADPNMAGQIPASDVKSLRAMFRGLGAKKARQAG